MASAFERLRYLRRTHMHAMMTSSSAATVQAVAIAIVLVLFVARSGFGRHRATGHASQLLGGN